VPAGEYGPCADEGTSAGANRKPDHQCRHIRRGNEKRDQHGAAAIRTLPILRKYKRCNAIVGSTVWQFPLANFPVARRLSGTEATRWRERGDPPSS